MSFLWYLLVLIIFFESNNIHDFIDKIAEFAEYCLPQLAFFLSVILCNQQNEICNTQIWNKLALLWKMTQMQIQNIYEHIILS